jgi:hypothetical protein
VVLQGLYLKPKAMPTVITKKDLVAVLVLDLHVLEALENLIISKSMWVADSVDRLEDSLVEDLDQEEVKLLEDKLEPAAMLLVKQVVLIKDKVSMEGVDSVVVMASAEVMVVLIMKLLVLLIKEVVASLKVHQEEVNPVPLVIQVVSRVVDSEVSTLLELILSREVVLQVSQVVPLEDLFQAEPTLNQPVTLQVNLPLEKLAVIIRVDLEVLEMMLLLLKSLEMVVAAAVVSTIRLTIYLDLHPVEGSVVQKVTLRASLRLLLLVV